MHNCYGKRTDTAFVSR